MKVYLALFFILSVALAKFDNNCGYTSYYSYTTILKLCYPDNYDADSDTTHYIRFNYENHDGDEVQTGWVKLDNINCDDFQRGTCDYFDVVPDDASKLNFMDLGAYDADGLQIAVMEIGYNDGKNLAVIDLSIDNNECYSRLQDEVSDPEYIWLNVGDVCQTIRVRFGDVDPTKNIQYTTMVYGIQQCVSAYDYVIGEISDDCESCYDQINTAAYCGQETSCGESYADDDQYLKICMSIYDYADTDDNVYIRYSYTSTEGTYTISDWFNADNWACDDFQLSMCDYFDIVPSDIAEMDKLDIWLDGVNGMQIQQVVVKYQPDRYAQHFGSVSNDCISYQGDFDINIDPEYIWLDADDACKIARIQFGATYEESQNSEVIYALQDFCLCDVPYLEDFASVDCDSCYVYCNDIPCGESVGCDIVTLYSEYDFGGDSVEVEDENDCLPFIPASICIPDGNTARIFGGCEYSDQSYDLTESSENLDEYYANYDDTTLIGKAETKRLFKSKKQLQAEDAVIKVVVV